MERVGNDRDAEQATVRAYNAAVRLAHEAEKQRAQIEYMGLESYLANQVEGAQG